MQTRRLANQTRNRRLAHQTGFCYPPPRTKCFMRAAVACAGARDRMHASTALCKWCTSCEACPTTRTASDGRNARRRVAVMHTAGPHFHADRQTTAIATARAPRTPTPEPQLLHYAGPRMHPGRRGVGGIASAGHSSRTWPTLVDSPAPAARTTPYPATAGSLSSRLGRRRCEHNGPRTLAKPCRPRKSCRKGLQL